MSLIDNSSKYNHKDEQIDIKVTLNHSNLLFAIKDRGWGISSEVQSHIFERFYRDYQNNDVVAQRGQGLSLYLCKQIIEMHGGKIWFESELGVGTTFYFTLPLAE